MIRLTEDKAVHVTDVEPEIYLEDDDLKILLEDREARAMLLKELELKEVVVGRVGTPVKPELLYETREVTIDLPYLPIKREVGYYHRL